MAYDSYGSSANRPPRVTYRPYHFSDAHQAQAMIQGSSFSSLSFNTHAGNIIFLAVEGWSIKAIATAHIDYRDNQTLVLGECYMRGGWGNQEHLDELYIALKLWALQEYGVKWFHMNDYESAHPIGIQGIMDRAAAESNAVVTPSEYAETPENSAVLADNYAMAPA